MTSVNDRFNVFGSFFQNFGRPYGTKQIHYGVVLYILRSKLQYVYKISESVGGFLERDWILGRVTGC